MWRVAKLNLRQSSQIIFYNFLLAISSQEVNQLKSVRERTRTHTHTHTVQAYTVQTHTVQTHTHTCMLNNTNQLPARHAQHLFGWAFACLPSVLLIKREFMHTHVAHTPRQPQLTLPTASYCCFSCSTHTKLTTIRQHSNAQLASTFIFLFTTPTRIIHAGQLRGPTNAVNIEF